MSPSILIHDRKAHPNADEAKCPHSTLRRYSFLPSELPQCLPLHYTALIMRYLGDGMLRESVLVYNAMQRDCLKPLSFTFAALLKMSASESNADLGRQFHGESIKLGVFDADLFVVNTLIHMYVKCGSLVSGRKVFNEMRERDLISWTSLIDAYARQMDRSSDLFRSMPVKDIVAWTAMVTGFAHNAAEGESQTGRLLHSSLAIPRQHNKK